jgi:hypothetical protein
MEEIEVNLEICTLYKGVPYGPAIISHTDNNDPSFSFKGVGLFRDGKLHNTPFTYVRETGCGASFTKMIDGRPSDSNYHTYFSKNGQLEHVDSTVEKTNVSGW